MPLIYPEQFGFKAQHSSTSQLMNVIDDIFNYLNRRYKIAAALLDIEIIMLIVES